MAAITMTRKGNIRIDGVKYKAKPSRGCAGCVLFPFPSCNEADCTDSAREGKVGYKIRQAVIFVKKEPKQ